MRHTITGALAIAATVASMATAQLQEAKLLASDAAAGDLFGYSVALSGDTALIGATYDQDNGYRSGSAYVFVRSGGGVWTQQARLRSTRGARIVFRQRELV